MTTKLYENTTKIDKKTGLPEDYNSLFAGYRNLVTAAAQRVGIPAQDAEDAAQEVQLKFWAKGGLDFYDSEKKTKFASMYRGWTSMFMLQERDKYLKNKTRHVPVDAIENGQVFDKTETDFSKEIIAESAINSWVERASLALSGKPYLVPLLHKCVEAAEANKTMTRADVIEATGCKLRQATGLLQELRDTLNEAGMGAQSIYAD